MKKKFGALIIIMSLLTSSLLAGCQAGGASADGVIHLKFGIVNSDTTNYYKGCVAIADEVREATNGKIDIKIYPSGQLGNERDLYEGAQLGSIDMFYAANAVMSSFIPEMKVLDQPFLFENAEEAHNVIDGELGELIAKKAEVQGIKDGRIRYKGKPEEVITKDNMREIYDVECEVINRGSNQILIQYT